MKIDLVVSSAIPEIGKRRPTYGTRRMAAHVSRELDIHVNRKKVKRIYRKLGWNEPEKTKSEIIRSNKKLLRPVRPDQLWEADMSYVWCRTGGWCLLF